MSVNIWANAKDVPGVICSDARLTDRKKTKDWPWSSREVTTSDQEYGQAGWDVGLNFNSADDLAGQLEQLKLPKYVAGTPRSMTRGEVQRLAIHSHGNSGTIFINGTESLALTAKTVLDPALRTPLVRIGLMTPDNAQDPAVILFVGCLAANGKDGSDLLKSLSKLWPNRRVVGFITIGYSAVDEAERKGEKCTEPGMRDTAIQEPGGADAVAKKLWHDLEKWPWAADKSPRSKVAYNGSIVFGKQWD